MVDRLPNPRASVRFDELISDLGIIVEPVTAHQATTAREAHRRFGRGSGHPAKLNIGDCFAYALAKDLEEPLLFVGQDFIHTDVRRDLDCPDCDPQSAALNNGCRDLILSMMALPRAVPARSKNPMTASA